MQQTVSCSTCGKSIPAHAVFCPDCGTRVQPLVPPASSSAGTGGFVPPASSSAGAGEGLASAPAATPHKRRGKRLALALLVILVLLVAGLSGGAYLLLHKSSSTANKGGPNNGPTVKPQPVPKAWANVLHQIKPDGTASLSTALQAFSLAIGPLPQVTLPEPLDGPIPDGSIAVRMLRAHWKELTPDQQNAANQYLKISAAQGQISAGQVSANLASDTLAPPPDDPGTGPERKIVNDVIAFLQANLKHTLSIPTQISWKFDPQRAGNDADAYVDPVNASGMIEGQPALCPIFLKQSVFQNPNDYAADFILAHEVMHCFQADILGDVYVLDTSPGWIIEGQAEWAGLTYADQASSGIDAIAGEWWQQWFDYNNRQTPLFQRSYDAVGYYSLLDKAGVSPWDVFTPMLQKVQNNLAAYQVGASQAGETLLDDWAAGNELDPSLGMDWNLTGPGINRIALQTNIPAIIMGNGDMQMLNAAPFTDTNVDITSQADVLEVAGTGHIRLIDTGQTERLNDAANGFYCTKQGGCMCPSDSLYDGPPLQDLTGLIRLAVTGGTDGAAGAVMAISLETYCNKNIPDNLKRARPMDATLNIVDPDTQAIVGNGVATRSPDLFSFKEQIDFKDPSKGYFEEVIDYTNDLVYFRILPSPTWHVQHAHIAHWYDLMNPTVLGTETINGVKTYHIRGTVFSGNHTWDQDVWVRVDNLYLVQVLTELAGSTQPILLVITSYNTGATVTVPTDVQNG